MKKIAILCAVFLLSSLAILAQPANDFCQNAISIGNLPLGSQRCTQGTNVGANPEFPFPFQNICTSGGSTPSAADDVWFTFTMPANANELRVSLTGSLPSYSIAIYRGTCGSLSGYGCATAGGGGINNVTIQPLAGGQTYYIQVSGGTTGAQGTFNLCLTARDNPNLCVVQSSMTASPQPVNGSYNPGQVITFCYTVSDYDQLGVNWFHGLQIIMGAGWQGSLTPVSPAASCDGDGVWGFYNSVTSSNTGMVVGPGFFYDRTPLDGNPGNNFGDDCGNNNWTFCWQATVPSLNCNSANPDLSVRVRPFSDGQTGSWYDLTCNVTPTFVFSAVLECCEQPLITTYDETCPGACDGIAIAEGQGGVAPYSYAWGSGAMMDTANALCSGPVNVTVTDAAGCDAITTVVINSGSNLSISAAGANETCPGAADGKAWVVNASPSLIYTWNTVPPQTGDSVFALAAGTYQVIGNGIAGCADTTTVTIGSGGNLNISLGKRDATCTGAANGKAWVVSGNPAFTYAWNTVPPQNGDTAFNLAPGTYELVATGLAGCADTANVTILDPAPLLARATADTLICGTATGNVYATAAGGTAPYTYAWNTNPVQNTATATNLAPGPYTVIITDAGGCTASANATIVSTPSFVTAIGSRNVSCFGATDGKAWAVPNGGQAPYSYVWSTNPPQFTDTAFNLPAGTYTATVTDFAGCTDQFGFVIAQPASIVATSSITNATCNGFADGSITLSVSGGALPYSYLWSNNATGPNATGITAGTYSVVITDANGCSITLNNLVVTEPAALSLVATPDSVSCYGGFDGGVTLAVTGGTPTYSYLWSNTRINQNLVYLVAGSYSVTVTDRNGCIDSTTAVVGQPLDFTINTALANVSCFGASDGSIDVQVTGATPPYQYGWSANTNNFAGNTLSSLSGASYQITITDANSCSTTRSYNIFEPTRMRTILDYSIDSTACDGTIIQGSITNNTAGGTPPFAFNWSSGDTTRDITANLVYGTYTITATDVNGCADTVAVTLNPKELLQVEFLSDSSGCFGDSSGTAEVIITGGRKPYFTTWSGELDSSNATFVNHLAPGNYDVTVTDSKGCDTTFNFTITEQPEMGIDVPDTLTVVYGLDTTFTAQVTGVRTDDANNIFWNPSEWLSCDDCVDPTLTAVRNRQYVVQLDVNGCLYYDTLQLLVDHGPDPYFIPDAFTPNGDGINDNFQVFGVGIRDVEITIYDRWGELVFFGNGLNATWDGTFKGQAAQNGIYVYNIHFIFFDTHTERVTGSITLFR